jgi:hypothetical protein
MSQDRRRVVSEQAEISCIKGVATITMTRMDL